MAEDIPNFFKKNICVNPFVSIFFPFYFQCEAIGHMPIQMPLKQSIACPKKVKTPCEQPKLKHT